MICQQAFRLMAFDSEVVVGEDGAFRRAGGAGCVDDRRGIVAVERLRSLDIGVRGLGLCG